MFCLCKMNTQPRTAHQTTPAISCKGISFPVIRQCTLKRREKKHNKNWRHRARASRLTISNRIFSIDVPPFTTHRESFKAPKSSHHGKDLHLRSQGVHIPSPHRELMFGCHSETRYENCLLHGSPSNYISDAVDRVHPYHSVIRK